jgi:transitional endoplasmic reticulum ATPase
MAWYVMTESELTVEEAYPRDVGRGVVRIGKNTMDALRATSGDIVEIYGQQKAVAKCLPLYPADEGKKIIRVDGLVQNNCQANIGNSVVVRKIKHTDAGSVLVMPLESIPPIDPRYIADALESMPLISGQYVMVPYFGGRLTFKVVGTIPAVTNDVEAVIVTQKTVFAILDKKLGLDSSDQSIEDARYSLLQKIWTVEKLSKHEFDDLVNDLAKFYDVVHKKIK